MLKIKKTEYQNNFGVFKYYEHKNRYCNFSIIKSLNTKTYTIYCRHLKDHLRNDEGGVFFRTQKEVSEAIRIFLKGK